MTKVAEKGGISTTIFRKDYKSTPEPETVAGLAHGAAEAFHLDEKRLLGWLYGADDMEFQAYLAQLVHLEECNKCHWWFPEDEMVPGLYRCRPCVAEDSKEKAFQRRLATDAALAQRYTDFWRRVPAVKEQDEELHRALEALRGQAITKPKVARTLGVSLAEAVRRLTAVSLIGVIAALLGGAGRVETLENRVPTSPKVGPSRRRKGRSSSPGAAAASSSGPPKKKGRRGRSPQPGEAAPLVTGARRAPSVTGLAGGQRRAAMTGACVLLEQGGDHG